MTATRLLLVDDSALFLESIERFLAAFPEIAVIGKAGSGDEALRSIAELRPDLVLMDLKMPGMNGLEATRRIKMLPDAPRIVIVTMHDTAEYRVAAEAAGADGFIGKFDIAEALLPLIRSLFAASDKSGN